MSVQLDELQGRAALGRGQHDPQARNCRNSRGAVGHLFPLTPAFSNQQQISLDLAAFASKQSIQHH